MELNLKDKINFKRHKNYMTFYSEIKTEDSNENIIFTQITKDQGKYVYFDFFGNVEENRRGLLLSVCSDDLDYYYVYLTPSLEIKFMTCLADYHIIDEKDIPTELSKITIEDITSLLEQRFNNTNSVDVLLYWGKY